MRIVWLLVLALTAQAPSFSPIQDGDAHGDPPFLLEDGWEPLLDGASLAGWQACDATATNEWKAVRAIRYERILGPTQLSGRGTAGGVIINGNGKTANLCSTRAFGDIELYAEFMLAKGSNSGIYLQGLYELQILDSWGTTEPVSSSDLGGIYHQWIDNRGVGGSAPRVNAARRPGEWQSYQAWYRAPRLDASGRKTEPARFLRVLLNGQLVQADVEVAGPTRAALDHPEGPTYPLMLQGDHGPVAFRNIHVRPLRPLIMR
jgi:hypothetical protein